MTKCVKSTLLDGAVQEGFPGEGTASSGLGEGQRVRHSRPWEACVLGDLE